MILADNLLTEFPATINGHTLPHLKTLNLRRCGISMCPACVLHVPCMCTVQLLMYEYSYFSSCSNQISGIVDKDLRLIDLEELFLSKNAIQQVPEMFMASMLALRLLDISHNQLGELAACM